MIRMKKQSFRQRLSWKLFMMKVRYWNWEINFNHAKKRWIHCKRGFHYFVPQSLKVTRHSYGKRERCIIDVKWFQCMNCNLMFFFNKEDKAKYNKYKAKEHNDLIRGLKSFTKAKGNSGVATKAG